MAGGGLCRLRCPPSSLLLMLRHCHYLFNTLADVVVICCSATLYLYGWFFACVCVYIVNEPSTAKEVALIAAVVAATAATTSQNHNSYNNSVAFVMPTDSKEPTEHNLTALLACSEGSHGFAHFRSSFIKWLKRRVPLNGAYDAEAALICLFFYIYTLNMKFVAPRRKRRRP